MVSSTPSPSPSFSDTGLDEPLPPHVPVGIFNKGLTCHLSALLQTLFSIPRLMQPILQNTARIHPSTTNHSERVLLELCRMYLRKVSKIVYTQIDPAALIAALEAHPLFHGINLNSEQDPSEVLSKLMEIVEEVATAMRAPSPGSLAGSPATPSPPKTSMPDLFRFTENHVSFQEHLELNHTEVDRLLKTASISPQDSTTMFIIPPGAGVSHLEDLLLQQMFPFCDFSLARTVLSSGEPATEEQIRQIMPSSLEEFQRPWMLKSTAEVMCFHISQTSRDNLSQVVFPERLNLGPFHQENLAQTFKCIFDLRQTLHEDRHKRDLSAALSHFQDAFNSWVDCSSPSASLTLRYPNGEVASHTVAEHVTALSKIFQPVNDHASWVKQVISQQYEAINAVGSDPFVLHALVMFKRQDNDGGHYYMMLNRHELSADGQALWWLCDDLKISELTFAEVTQRFDAVNNAGYLAFYIKEGSSLLGNSFLDYALIRDANSRSIHLIDEIIRENTAHVEVAEPQAHPGFLFLEEGLPLTLGRALAYLGLGHVFGADHCQTVEEFYVRAVWDIVTGLCLTPPASRKLSSSTNSFIKLHISMASLHETIRNFGFRLFFFVAFGTVYDLYNKVPETVVSHCQFLVKAMTHLGVKPFIPHRSVEALLAYHTLGIGLPPEQGSVVTFMCPRDNEPGFPLDILSMLEVPLQPLASLK
ncbi:hypothetical protein H696_01747 [Fonticula alba]|uniref:ubiquitinyl hydrolase 1 n=1 Tax=Fonticula alba TaxID=691883 RepID=A0A058ZD91_FONAL|nr:hypothetical protein H696_01747 [Fonticula alba]KCV72354.1 hypothetical protein H696_01747 [Fonticula alba]|eukprot:XP_009493932.1 hypothetical protein H696_01747 [Fonticula alba]